jgi:hypothetical protein
MLTWMRNMTSKFLFLYLSCFHMYNDRLKEKMNYSVLLEHKIKWHILNSNWKSHAYKCVIKQILSVNV